MTDFPTRRMALVLGGAAALGPKIAGAATATPEQTEGPFYPTGPDRVADDDWDLVKVEGRVREAGGQILHLAGRVLDRAGRPVAGSAVEIWQCDVNGRYHHHRDSGGGRALDADFQGFGRTVTDGDGRYRFRTIRPVSYPGRTPHVHAKVMRPDGSVLTTQIYLADEPANAGDFIFRSLGRAGQEAASMEVGLTGDGTFAAVFDFVV